MKGIPRLLICDDDPIYQLSVKAIVKGLFECLSAYNSDEAVAILNNQSIDVILLDIHLRDSNEGLRVIPKFFEIDPDLTIVINSAIKDFQIVREAMRLGAIDYIVKDFASDDLIHTLNRAIKHRILLQKNRQQTFETRTVHHQNRLIGESPIAQSLQRTIEKARKSSANVLIYGETGSGKELVARQLRKAFSDSSLEPFVAIDSGTIQSSMAESILFGHEKGAFTGADRIVKGIFEEANGGTVYFDEISNMPVNIQAKLLRVLQEKEVTRVGSTRAIKLDFRIICATNKNLEIMAQNGEFKDDLLQRINVIPISIPPLRERHDDIPLLIDYFVKKHCPKEKLIFSNEALAALKKYRWPGNIRELSNLVAYLATMFDGAVVEIQDLPEKFQFPSSSAGDFHFLNENTSNESSFTTSNYYNTLAAFEAKLLHREYVKHNGNISQLSLALQMDRSHLYSKLKSFGIHSARTKSSKTAFK